MKNYYILIPLIPTNIVGVYDFINDNKDNFENIGNNNVLLPIMHPTNVACLCYQIELKEELITEYKTVLESLNAEIYESAEAYLLAYPQSIEIEI